MTGHKWFFDSRICWTILGAYFFLALLPSDAGAFLVQSRLSSGQTIEQRTQDIASIRTALEQKVVAQKLADYGLTADEVGAKLDSLNDEQLHQLASLSDDMGGGVIGAVIGVLLVILLVIVILKISDRRIVVQ
jgi:hypothetical protein